MIYLTIEFLIKFKQYREWHLTSFYVFAYGVVIARLIDLSFHITYIVNNVHLIGMLDDMTYVVCTNFKLLLGAV